MWQASERHLLAPKIILDNARLPNAGSEATIFQNCFFFVAKFIVLCGDLLSIFLTYMTIQAIIAA